MCRLIVGCLIGYLFAAPARADHDPTPIRDGSRLFSPEAVQRATRQILEFRQIAHLDLVLETTDTLPSDVITRHGRFPNVPKIVAEYARHQAAADDVNGVFVFISTMPDYRAVAVVVRPDENRSRFTDRNREQLRSLLESTLRKDPDKALEKGVALVREKVKANQQADSSWLGWGTVFALIGGLLAVWVVFGLIRMRMLRDPAPSPETPAVTARHAGFVPGLLGGMFGSVAGYWIYDTFFQNRAPSAGANAPSTNGRAHSDQPS
jgi:hypothetical protein